MPSSCDWSDFTSLQIGHATSPDGIHWTKDPANPILPKGAGNDVVQDPNSKEAKRQRAKSKGSSAVGLPGRPSAGRLTTDKANS